MVFVSVIELILFFLLAAIPVIGHAIAPFVLAFSIILSIAAFIFGVVAYYVSTIIFKDPATAIRYALLVALLEFITSFDPISTIIAFIGGYVSFKVAGQIGALKQPRPKTEATAKST